MRRQLPMNIWIMIVTMLVLQACNKLDHQNGVIDTVRRASTPVRSSHADNNIDLTDLSLVKAQPVYQGGVFYTESRQEKIGRYPCSNCHDGTTSTITDAREMAHGEILLNHGAVTRPDACDTCHNEDNRDVLVGENGKQIGFDHSYQMCAQCHFRQEKDWIGGAHGKRLKYWAGKRAIANCTSCHDPHSPGFKMRWPATYSRPVPSESAFYSEK